MFSVVAVPVYIPTNSEGRCPLLHTLYSICYLWTFKVAILTGVRLYLIAVLIYIFLIISDVEHFFFMCLLGICIYSLEKYLFSFFAHFSIGGVGFFAVELYKLYILEINPLSVASFETIFCHSVGWLYFYGFLRCAKSCQFD